MSTQNTGRRGGSRGGFRGRGGPGGGGKRKAPIPAVTAIASGGVTPALTSGQSTPAPMPSALDGAKTQTRFRDLPGLTEALLKNIPFEYCTEVSATCWPFECPYQGPIRSQELTRRFKPRRSRPSSRRTMSSPRPRPVPARPSPSSFPLSSVCLMPSRPRRSSPPSLSSAPPASLPPRSVTPPRVCFRTRDLASSVSSAERTLAPTFATSVTSGMYRHVGH